MSAKEYGWISHVRRKHTLPFDLKPPRSASLKSEFYLFLLLDFPSTQIAEILKSEPITRFCNYLACRFFFASFLEEYNVFLKVTYIPCWKIFHSGNVFRIIYKKAIETSYTWQLSFKISIWFKQHRRITETGCQAIWKWPYSSSERCLHSGAELPTPGNASERNSISCGRQDYKYCPINYNLRMHNVTNEILFNTYLCILRFLCSFSVTYLGFL
jgi:hypothetical protein